MNIIKFSLPIFLLVGYYKVKWVLGLMQTVIDFEEMRFSNVTEKSVADFSELKFKRLNRTHYILVGYLGVRKDVLKETEINVRIKKKRS
jgi:hypothetical protein